MKIACFLPDMGGGGAERVMLALIEDLVLRGHEVHLLVMNGRGSLMHLIPQPVRIFNFELFQSFIAFLSNQRVKDGFEVCLGNRVACNQVSKRFSVSSAKASQDRSISGFARFPELPCHLVSIQSRNAEI